MITSTTVLIDMIVLVGVSPFGPGCTIIEKNHVSRTYYSIFRVNKGYFFTLSTPPIADCLLAGNQRRLDTQADLTPHYHIVIPM